MIHEIMKYKTEIQKYSEGSFLFVLKVVSIIHTLKILCLVSQKFVKTLEIHKKGGGGGI